MVLPILQRSEQCPSRLMLGAFGQQQQAEEEYRYSEKQRRMQDRFAMNDYNRRVQRSQNDWNSFVIKYSSKTI